MNVQIDFDFPTSEDEETPNLKAVLLDASNEEFETTSVDYSEIEKTLYLEFKNMMEGKYTLKISGEGYIDYVNDNIEIEPHATKKLILTNSHETLLSDERIGVIAIGDVNGDGKIDDDDISEMKDAIEAKSTDDKYDFNKDGKLDIADLSYVVLNKGKENKIGDTLHLLNVEKAEVEHDENTAIEGNVNDILLNNGKAVTLSPANDEEISISNPVNLSIDMHNDNETKTEGFVISPSNNPENNIKAGTITVEVIEEDGRPGIRELEIVEEEVNRYQSAKVINNNYQSAKVINNSYQGAKVINNNYQGAKVIDDETGIVSINKLYKAGEEHSGDIAETTTKGTAKIAKDGSIVIDLGGKVAVKKVTIKVTGTTGNTLADISSVEFLNEMKDKIQPPEMNIPKITDVVEGNEEFTVSWSKENNVTGYEVSITSTPSAITNNAKPIKEVVSVAVPTITVTRFNNDDVVNGDIYYVQV